MQLTFKHYLLFSFVLIACSVLPLEYSRAARKSISNQSGPKGICDDKLIPDTSTLKADRSVHLSSLSLITSENFEQVKKDGKLGAEVVLEGVPISGYANYNSFREARSRYYKRYDYKYDETTSRFYTQSKLSRESVEAYLGCLRSQSIGLFLMLSDVTETGATLHILYKNAPLDGKTKTLTNQPSFRGVNPTPKIDTTWGPGEGRSYPLDRIKDSELRVTMNLAGHPATVFVPLPPKLAGPIFKYDYAALEENGFPHYEPVERSTRFCNKDCPGKATAMCKTLGHDALVRFTPRDENRAVGTLTCRDQEGGAANY